MPLLLLSACAKVEEPAQTEPPQKAALAPEERLYARSEAGYNLSGRNFTLEGLSTLSAALNAQPWDDLATFVLAFDLHTAADLRFCDFRPYGSVVSTQPQCLEEGAYISLRGDVFCALVFTLEDGLYAPKCLVLSRGVILTPSPCGKPSCAARTAACFSSMAARMAARIMRFGTAAKRAKCFFRSLFR